MTKAALIIVAGGTGSRTGTGRPKQWEPLLGKRVIDWSIDVGLAHPEIAQVIVVSAPNKFPKGVTHVQGGATRADSVRNGLSAVDIGTDPFVLVHDAARPGLTKSIISQLLAALTEADAAAPAMTISDAVKRETNGTVETINREGLYTVQTPQAFRMSKLKSALASTTDAWVDDLSAVERLGAKIKLISGDARLNKITYAEDFALMTRVLGPFPVVPRVGKGFDVHAFESGTYVTLCGVQIPHTAKLSGHSDADAAWHALTDAILGAAALGDIGDHFPPSDARWKNADSAIFLKAAQDLARHAGFDVSSCDITVICEAPKVKPHREAMRERTANLLGLPLSFVSVKATTTEQLGFTGRKEGIAAEAIAVLVPRA